MHNQIDELIAETMKINVDASKITAEIFWMPLAISIGLISSVATMTAVILKLL
jgi:hypothetical protein